MPFKNSTRTAPEPISYVPVPQESEPVVVHDPWTKVAVFLSLANLAGLAYVLSLLLT